VCDVAVQILSKDSVTVAVDAVVYYRVSNATVSVTNVEDVNRSTRLLAQTTLRNVLGTKNLSEILSDRENISHFMQVSRCNISAGGSRHVRQSEQAQ
jgi:erythrocyte band 7 integral membrane protein